MGKNISRALEVFASKFAELVGTSYGLVAALIVGLLWVSMLGRDQAFGISRTTLVEFANIFMFIHLFLLQGIQTKSVMALHLKLDELIASKDGANNDLIKAERSFKDEINALHGKYVDLAESDKDPTAAIGLKSDSKEPAENLKAS